MSRLYLIKAREERDLSQRDLAELLDVQQSSLSKWESGTDTPQPYQRRKIRGILKRDVDLYPYLFDLDSQWSPRGIKDIMEMLRRHFIEAMAKFGGISLFDNVTIEIVTEPKIPLEEYIYQAETSISNCWGLLNGGEYRKVDDTLNSHLPTLARLINVASPFQSDAARLGVQACIMKICIAKQSLDYAACSRYCSTIEKYAIRADNPAILAVAQKWQGNTYSEFFYQPQRAVPILLKALSNTQDSEVLGSSIHSNLSRAYAQWIDEDGFEDKAQKHLTLAHDTFPTLPTLDPYYQQVQMSASELSQFNAWANINLARSTKNNEYAVKAFDMLKSTGQAPMSLHYTCTLHTKKAEVAALLGYKDVTIENLEKGVNLAMSMDSMQKLNNINTVISGIPKDWQQEALIQDISHEIGKALVVVKA